MLDPRLLDGLALAGSLGACACALIARKRARAGADAALADSMASEGKPAKRDALLAPIARALRPTSLVELDQLSARLACAGRRGRDAVDRYLEEKVRFLVVSLTVGVVLALMAKGGGGVLLLCASLVFGLLYPEKRIDRLAGARREAVAKSLPPAVDLLVTCLEAGLTIEQAMARVGRDLAHSSPVLAYELNLTAGELEAGVSLPDALRRLGRRVGLDELSALCGVLAQAHGLGAPIAQTLREYATASRRQRMLTLEERAGQLSTLLTLPLALCLLPAAMMAILGPAVLQLVEAFR